MTIVRMQCLAVRQPPVVLGGAHQAKLRDWDSLEPLFSAYKNEIDHQDGLVPDAGALSEHLSARRQGVERGEYWVWEVSGLIVAAGGYWTGDDVPEGEAEIGALVTAPEHRRQGFAQNLGTALCLAALREGLVPVVQIERESAASLGVCTAIGFTEPT